MKSETFERLKARVPEETRIYVRKYSQLLDRIDYLFGQKQINQKQLADALNKKPSEISKWMNTEQNLTLKTICKIEAVLGAPLLVVPENIHIPYNFLQKFSWEGATAPYSAPSEIPARFIPYPLAS